MLMLRVLLCVALLAMLTPEQTEAWPGFRFVKAAIRVVKIIRRWGRRDSIPAVGQLCNNVKKAIIEREEWSAMKPRQQEPFDGIPDKVIIHQTGADTCKVMGLSGANCQSCLQHDSCVKELILAMQNADFENGKSDIRYNFLIGEDGVIYEGRGYDVVGGHTRAYDKTSIGVAILGDFSKSEPNEAVQTALNNLLLCGQSDGVLSRDASLVTEPRMSGKAVDELIRRCRGLCVA